jgi:lauroyl/myristoyl acyltransferase
MIEHEIRREPRLWLWIHKRWNTRPADETKDA